MQNRLDELLIGLGSAVFLVILSWWLPGSTYQLMVIIFAFLYGTFGFGLAIAPKSQTLKSAILGLLATASGLSLCLTIAYYLSIPLSISTAGYALAATMVIWSTLFFFLPTPSTIDEEVFPKPDKPWLIVICVLAATLFITFCGQALWNAGTLISIRTPWPELPTGIIPALAGLSLTGLLLAFILKQGRYTAIIIALSLVLIAAIAPSVYRLGFGFDGFIHRASETVLIQTGTLNPKPPYYIGIYVWNIWVSQITTLPIQLIDVWMNILLLCAIPFIVYWATKRTQAALATAGIIALAPLSAFIGSTPQTTAYIVGCITIGLALAHEKEQDHLIWLVLALGAWAVAIHPLAGLPFYLVAIACLLETPTEHTALWRHLAAGLLAACAVIAVPIAFYLNSLHGNATIQWDWHALSQLQTYWNGLMQIFSAPHTHVSLLTDGASAIAFFVPWLALILACIAAWKDNKSRSRWLVLILTGLGLMLMALILKASGDFAFLIDYERGNYADRLIIVGWLCWLIPACVGFHLGLDKANRSSRLAFALLCLLLVGWQAGQIYSSYPRNDASEVGHGWSVGQADFEAVRYINQDAGSQTYTVLANQTVSAAAMQLNGFKRYAGDVFYYPIPTGGPLYQLYLSAVGDHPSRDIINEAATLGQSKIVYVVLNNYWWNADQVKEQLTQIADKSQTFGDGSVTVFRFDSTSSASASK